MKKDALILFLVCFMGIVIVIQGIVCCLFGSFLLNDKTPPAAAQSKAEGINNPALFPCFVFSVCEKGNEAQLSRLGTEILAQRRINPAWEKQIIAIHMSIMQSRIKTMEASRKILADKQDYIRNLQMDAYKNRTQTSERILGKWDEFIKDVSEIDNPISSGETLLIDNNRDHAFFDGTSTIYSDDPEYDPNSDDFVNSTRW